MEILPHFATKEGVVAIGELGYDEQTALEDKYLRAQIELAKEVELPIMIHTPHRDKKRGTLRTMDVLKEHKFDPAHCVVDHNNEETVADVLDRGYFAGFSIYPQTKMSNERMTEIVRQYGPERIIVDSACDWGVSDPLAVPKTAALMAEKRHRRRRHSRRHLHECARGLRPFRRHEGSSTGSSRRRSTSARCSRATACCAAARRRGSRHHAAWRAICGSIEVGLNRQPVAPGRSCRSRSRLAPTTRDRHSSPG